MKTLLVAFCILSLTALAFAGPEPTPTPSPSPTPSIQQSVISEIETDAVNGFFEVSMNPTLAPKLAKQWGGEFTIDHPIGSYAFAGVNAMVLNGGYFAGTVGIGAKASFNVGKLIVTPYVSVGAFKPFTVGNSSSGTQSTTSVGASAGTGASVLIFQNAAKTLDVSGYGGIEYVTLYPGVQIYQLGLKVGYHF